MNQEQDLFFYHTYNNKQIRQRITDGYFSATDMCQSVDKNIHDFIRLKSTENYMEALSKTLSIPKTQLIYTRKGNYSDRKGQGTWIHSQVTTILGMWMSPEFTVKVGMWIEEWKLYRIKNSEDYHENLCRLVVSKQEQLEKAIQKELCLELGGKMEVRTCSGHIDLLTDTQIIEIKEFSEWKSALGQVLSYSVHFPHHEKVIVLFGKMDTIMLNIIRETYEKYSITLVLKAQNSLLSQ